MMLLGWENALSRAGEEEFQGSMYVRTYIWFLDAIASPSTYLPDWVVE